ncbi:MAG: hypothetical protein V7745_04045 [Pseudomonadales bacterium]
MLFKRFLLLCSFFYFFSVVGTPQAALSNPDPSINNPSPSAGGQTAATASSSIFYPMQNLDYLALNAGEYAAWADACSDPAGVTVKTDLLSMLDTLTPAEKAKILQRFDNRYAQRKNSAEKRVKQCTATGRTDCCIAGYVAERMSRAKMHYQSSLKSTVAAATSSPPLPHYWNGFTRFAGEYAAWADACSDPAGVTVKTDFLSKADVLALGEKAGVIQNFEKTYAVTKKKAGKFVKHCMAKGATDCCTVGTSNGRQISYAKKYYQVMLEKFPVAVAVAVAASAQKSPGPSSTSVATAPISPAVSGAGAASPAAASTSTAPSVPLPASSPIPATPHALDILVNYASNYAGWAAACGEPVTVKQDYMAAANLLAPEYRGHRIKMFNFYFSGYFNRIKKAKDFFANPVSRSGQYEEGAIDPCTRADGDDYKKKYETALLAVQKSDADAKSQAAEKIKAKAEALSAASTPPQSSRIKEISKADLEPAAIQWSQLASWGVTDGTIMACTGVRDTMIRHNIMLMFEVAKIRERDIERLKETYDNNFTLYSKSPCGVGLPVNSVPPAEQVYSKYLKFQNYVLKCSAIIKSTPKGHDYNCGH